MAAIAGVFLAEELAQLDVEVLALLIIDTFPRPPSSDT